MLKRIINRFRKKSSEIDPVGIASTVLPENQPPLEEWLKEFKIGRQYTRFIKSKNISSIQIKNNES